MVQDAFSFSPIASGPQSAVAHFTEEETEAPKATEPQESWASPSLEDALPDLLLLLPLWLCPLGCLDPL